MRGALIMHGVPWPTHGGREVYSHHLLRALTDLGHEMHALLVRPDDDRPTDWPLRDRVAIHRADGATAAGEAPTHDADPPDTRPRNGLDRRWRRYWGWSDATLADVRRTLDRIRPDFVAAAGLDTLPALDVAPADAPRLWLALDEPARFQLSLGRSSGRVGEALRRGRLAACFAAYERTYARHVDAAVAVSTHDARALRRVGGFRDALHLPNGVDADYFRPPDEPVDVEPDTAVFWGRLDFRPNVQALAWFARSVWPQVTAWRGPAKLRVIGRAPPPELQRALAGRRGIELVGPVDDLRPWAARSAAVVLPIRSGAGIKNKLLEAAALARPIIASPRATSGLEVDDAWRGANTPASWVGQLRKVWDDPADAADLGRRARRWVVDRHNWRHNAEGLVAFVERAAACRRGPARRRAAAIARRRAA